MFLAFLVIPNEASGGVEFLGRLYRLPLPPLSLARCRSGRFLGPGGENVPSERVRSKPADIGQLLLQCRRRCSRVIVSLIPSNHTLSRGGLIGKKTKTTAREKPLNRHHQGLIPAAAASAIIRRDCHNNSNRQEEEVAAHNNLFKHLHNRRRPSELRASVPARSSATDGVRLNLRSRKRIQTQLGRENTVHHDG